MRRYEEGVVFRKKKRFHLLEAFLYKNGKAENVPVVAGRLFTQQICHALLIEVEIGLSFH